MKMRILGFLLLLLAAVASSPANHAIILIAPVDAGPNVSPESVQHPLWVTWPAAVDGTRVNQILSVTAPVGFQPPLVPPAFVDTGNGTWWNRTSPAPKPEKYDYVPYVAVGLDGKGFDRNVLLMASAGGSVAQTCQLNQISNYPNRHSFIAKAQSWDEVVALAKSIGDSAVVVEFPPRNGQNWSRVWLYENGRQVKDVPAGVFPSNYLDFMAREWTQEYVHEINPSHGYPDRWLNVGALRDEVLVGICLVGWLACIFMAWCLAREQHIRLARSVGCVPVAIFLAYRFLGWFAAWNGVQLWWLWFSLLALGIFGICFLSLPSQPGKLSRFASGALLPLVFLSLFVNENLSPFGPAFSLSTLPSGEILVFNALASTYLLMKNRGSEGPTWIATILLLPIAIGISLWPPSKGLNILPALYYLSILCWISGRKLVQMAPVVGMGILLVYLVVEEDFVWKVGPGSPGFVNLHRVIDGMFRPEWMITIISGLALVAFSSQFFQYQLTKAWKLIPEAQRMLQVCGITVLGCAFEPAMVIALPWAALFTITFWLQESLEVL